VVIEQLGTITLRSVPAAPPAWLPTLSTGARVWRIDNVQMTTAGVGFDLARGSGATFW
jgi:hypothetical protein